MTVPDPPGEPPRPDEHGGSDRAHGFGVRGADEPGGPDEPRRPGARERRAVLLRLDPAVHDALARWASDELRSVNAQIDLLLRDALAQHGRLPGGLHPPRRPGRPPATTPPATSPPADEMGTSP